MEKLISAVNEVTSVYFPEKENAFSFSRLYQCFMGSNQESIKEVFGESLLWRLRLHFKNLRKKVQHKELKIKLPSDSILFYKDDKKGFIIACPSKNFALKIFLDVPHIKLLDCEINTLKKIKGTAFEKSASSYIADGVTTQGARWVLSDFRSNRDSLHHSPDPDLLLLNLAYKEIMPRMAEFYRINEPQIILVKDWIEEAQKRAEKHPHKEVIVKALSEIKKDGALLVSAIHYDLHARNILRNNNQYSVIDWEGNLRSLVLVDGLDFLRRYLQRNQGKLRRFIKDLGMRNLTHDASRTLESFSQWQTKHFYLQSQIGPVDLIYIYVIERTLLFWEVRQINRLTDRRGIEFNVLLARS